MRVAISLRRNVLFIPAVKMRYVAMWRRATAQRSTSGSARRGSQRSRAFAATRGAIKRRSSRLASSSSLSCTADGEDPELADGLGKHGDVQPG